MRPLCKGSLDILRWRITTPKRVLFPYDPEESAALGSTVLIPAKRFAKEFPNSWAYLIENRRALEERESGKMRNDRWYGYVYPKSVSLFAKPKLMTPSIANAAAYAFDERGEFYFVGSGGGGGGGYGIIQKSDSPFSELTLLGILNSVVADYFIRQTASRFQGGYYAYSRQFIERVPLPVIGKTQNSLLPQVVALLTCCTNHFADHPEVQTTRDPLMVAYWERVLNGLVYELYFPEEVHGAGLRLFDLVAQAALPELEVGGAASPSARVVGAACSLASRKPGQAAPATVSRQAGPATTSGPAASTTLQGQAGLATLRQKFEELHDGTHPLRRALDKLATLDTVRIIECKV